MIEKVKHLRIDAQLPMLAQRKPLRQIQIAPDKIRSSQRIAPQIAELAALRTVASGARTGTRIDGGNERIRIQPLNRTRLHYASIDQAVLLALVRDRIRDRRVMVWLRRMDPARIYVSLVLDYGRGSDPCRAFNVGCISGTCGPAL